MWSPKCQVADKDYTNNGLGNLAVVSRRLFVHIFDIYIFRWNSSTCKSVQIALSFAPTGYECMLKDDKTCGNGKLCGVQNPPESLGEKQCFVTVSDNSTMSVLQFAW